VERDFAELGRIDGYQWDEGLWLDKKVDGPHILTGPSIGRKQKITVAHWMGGAAKAWGGAASPAAQMVGEKTMVTHMVRFCILLHAGNTPNHILGVDWLRRHQLWCAIGPP